MRISITSGFLLAALAGACSTGPGTGTDAGHLDGGVPGDPNAPGGAPTGTATGTATGAGTATGTATGAATGGPVVEVPVGFPPPPADDACGANVTPLGAGRCATNKVVAQGTALVLHDFEEAGENMDYLAAFFADKRAGEWWEAHFSETGATALLAVESQPGASASSQRALHYAGPAPGGWGATAGLAISDCYDASAYAGISFSLKGNAAQGNSWVKFSVHTPISEPEPAGGCSAADEAAEKCRDHYAIKVPVTSEWTRHQLTFQDLGQQCASNVPAGYNPGSEIITLSFSIADRNAGYDFWVDDLTLEVGTEPTTGFANILKKETFEELWRTENSMGEETDLRNAFYTYEGLVSAVQGFPGFATSGDATQNRREVAAFLANIAHESDSLALVEETACKNGSCEYGNFYGRGPIQLTWQNNYAAAGTALGQNLVANPNLVSTNPAIAFGTALWFWNSSNGAGSQTAHAGILAGSFGSTIRTINGALECGGKNAAAIQNRIEHYLRFCRFLGVDPGADLSC